eukprot:469234_1
MNSREFGQRRLLISRSVCRGRTVNEVDRWDGCPATRTPVPSLPEDFVESSFLTVKSASRVSERIQILSRLRWMMSIGAEEFKKRLEKANRTTPSTTSVRTSLTPQNFEAVMPEWWEPPHDVLLIAGTVRHGLDKAELILADEEFSAIVLLGGDKRLQFFMKFLADHLTLLRRFHFLWHVVQRGDEPYEPVPLWHEVLKSKTESDRFRSNITHRRHVPAPEPVQSHLRPAPVLRRPRRVFPPARRRRQWRAIHASTWLQWTAEGREGQRRR